MPLPISRATTVRIAYGGIAVAAAVAVALAFQQGAIGAKEVATAVLALLGTFLGATFAFRLNQDKEEKKLHKERREALNRAMFILARHANAVHQLKRDYEKFTDPIERAFNLPALKPPSYADVVHNFVDLEFLLESADPNILFRLTIEQERFQQVIESVNTRNEFYVNEYQPKLAAVALNGKLTTVQELSALLGERIFGGTLNGTAIAYEHLCASDVSIPEIQSALLSAAKKIYPGSKFVTYEKAV
jgi:hypothetical protein